jgi:hypothetical protein
MIAMEYMETGDKEEILEAIGVFAEHIDQRFELIDRRFEGVDRRFESIDRRFEKIESTMATKADIANLTDTLDWLVGHAKKHDQEFLMLAHGLKRVSDDVDKIKPLVGLA